MLAAALLPLAHHDIACHLKSTTHCTTCIIGSSAEAAADPAPLDRLRLRDAGRADPSAVPTAIECDARPVLIRPRASRVA